VRQAGRLPLVRQVTETTGRTALLTWADRLVLYALVALGLALLAIPGSGGSAGFARIEGAGGLAVTVPLDADGRREVPGPLGTTVVEVAGGSVRIVSSPCPNQVCVRMGAIRNTGQAVVCVPNRVVVRVLGEGASPTDAVTR
jgi:hypothetical protein